MFPCICLKLLPGTRKTDFPTCWSHQTQGRCCHVSLCQASCSTSFVLEHLIMTNTVWSQNRVGAAPEFLCRSTGRLQLKEQHNSSAAEPSEGPAAETEWNWGSGIKLDRRLIICLGKSREGKNGVREFAWQFWHLGGGFWKKTSYVGPYASRSGILAVQQSPWDGYHGPHGWLVSLGHMELIDRPVTATYVSELEEACEEKF